MDKPPEPKTKTFFGWTLGWAAKLSANKPPGNSTAFKTFDCLVELDREEWQRVVVDTLVGTVVGVDKQFLPATAQGVDVNSVTVVLGGDIPKIGMFWAATTFLICSTVDCITDGSPGPLDKNKPSYWPASDSKSWFHGTTFNSTPLLTKHLIWLYFIPMSKAKILKVLPSGPLTSGVSAFGVYKTGLGVETLATKFLTFGSSHSGISKCLVQLVEVASSTVALSVWTAILPNMEPDCLKCLVKALVSTPYMAGMFCSFNQVPKEDLAKKWENSSV
ncbi:hypothetical protein WICPIJ_007490 [Wickerhamomyces pijperi]|uniref:Uncharacterized protein n=1 Tax=Wickerhamomyces pijperi TaxID=599730 RepID=A0A9P8TK11_WICPI|nr:hypothetical protein WICPIJ_007490 [Wickerhamomyces pijperi]